MNESLTASSPQFYEIAFLVNKEDDLAWLKQIFAKYKAQIFEEKALVKTQLVYPIRKQSQAFFGVLKFNVETAVLPQILADLRLEKDILRSLVTKAGTFKKETGKRGRPSFREDKKEKSVNLPKEVKDFGPVLTNKAIQEKIEEILK